MSDLEIKRFDNRVRPGDDMPYHAPILPQVEISNRQDSHHIQPALPPIGVERQPTNDSYESYGSGDFENESVVSDATPPKMAATYISPVRNEPNATADKPHYEEYALESHQQQEPTYSNDHGGYQDQHQLQIGSSDNYDHHQIEQQRNVPMGDHHQSHQSSQIDLPDHDVQEGPGVCGTIIYYLAIILVVFTFPVSLWFCIKVVQEYERAVIFRLGSVLKEPKGPGMFFIIPGFEKFVNVDLRTLSIDVPPHEVLTKDCVTITVDAVVYYKVVKPQKSVVNVANSYRSTVLLSHTTLRSVLGTRELKEVLSSRDEIAEQMQAILDVGTDPWGILVERVEIKDVRLPRQLQRAMAKEAESRREAQAMLIAAEGEKLASKSLSEASKIIQGNRCALQLRYLQAISGIAQEKKSTILFPVPVRLSAAKKIS